MCLTHDELREMDRERRREPNRPAESPAARLARIARDAVEKRRATVFQGFYARLMRDLDQAASKGQSGLIVLDFVEKVPDPGDQRLVLDALKRDGFAVKRDRGRDPRDDDGWDRLTVSFGEPAADQPAADADPSGG